MNLKYIIAKAMKILLNPPARIKCKISKSSAVCSGSELSRVEMGKYSYIGNRCFMVNVKIGNFCSIADRCVIGGAMHTMNMVSTSPVFHSGRNVMKTNFSNHFPIETPLTEIGNDVWLGMGCFVKAGIRIGNGAVVGMGSVVTKDIPDYEIWAGNPAKFIRKRLDNEIINRLLEIRWWDWTDEKIQKYAPFFDDPQKLFDSLKENGEE